MNPVGKPDAGNPHVQFDERGWETGRPPRVSTRAHPRLYRRLQWPAGDEIAGVTRSLDRFFDPVCPRLYELTDDKHRSSVPLVIMASCVLCFC